MDIAHVNSNTILDILDNDALAIRVFTNVLNHQPVMAVSLRNMTIALSLVEGSNFWITNKKELIFIYCTR